MSGLISFNNSTPKTYYAKGSRRSPIHAELSYFMSNFFVIATEISHGKMILSSFNSQTSKNPC